MTANEAQDGAGNLRTSAPQPSRPLNPDQKRAIAAALIGTAALGGAAYGLSRIEDGSDQNADLNTAPPMPVAIAKPAPVEMKPAEPLTPEPAEPALIAMAEPASFDDGSKGGSGSGISVIPDEPVVSGNEYDGLSFEEAFAQAREDVGPGHYFEWHNDLYNTYYQDEWEGMSPTDQNAFLASIDGGMGPMDGVNTDAPEALAEATEAVPADETESAVAVVEEPVVTEAEPSYAEVEMDGHQVSLIDTDNDNVPNIMLLDTNEVLLDEDGDHTLEAQGTYNPATEAVENILPLDNPVAINTTMSMEPDAAAAGALADMSQDNDLGPDFDNHADVSDYHSAQ
jgi:hypothetical protein